MNQRPTIRLGASNYLNTKPLVYRLDRFAPRAEIAYDLPSRLADQLAAGRLDVALIPSIELFRNPQYTVVSDACVGCRGPVLSVKLLCRRPVEKVESVAVDVGSRTSAAAVRILLAEQFGLFPKLEPLPLGAAPADARTDAVLLIGDRAIRTRGEKAYAEVWDLGDRWCRWTGLPFVFALWVARAGSNLEDLPSAISEARDAGVASLEEIARAEAAPLGLSTDECLAYLRDNLHFRLGRRQQQGLDLFYRRARAMDLAPAGWELKLDDCRTGTKAAR